MEAQINLLPKQTEAWNFFEDDIVTELGYGGAAGGGKTRLGWYIAITISEQYPGARGAVGRKELKTLRITTLAELFIIFHELGYKKDKDYTYDAKDNIIKFANGSEILLLDTAYSPQDPEYTRFGSLPLTWAWIEESNETPEKAKAILKTRVGRKNKFLINNKEIEVKPFWLETFNPNKGHVYRDYYKPWKEGTLPPYRKFVRALPGDNPHLPSSYIENLKRADKVTRERLLNGNFDYDADPAKIMQYEAITDLLTNTIDEDDTRFMINDIARFGGDKIIISLWKGLRLYGLGVYTYQDLEETVRLIKEFSQNERVAFSRILSDEDGVGGGVVDALKGTKGFIGNSTPFEIFDTRLHKSIPANYTNLRSQCYFKLSELVNTRNMAVEIEVFKTNIPGYTVEKALSDLQEELDQIKQTDNSGQHTKLSIIPKSEIKEIIGRSPDFSDIMMMRMYFEFDKPSEIEEKNRHSTIYHRRKVNKIYGAY